MSKSSKEDKDKAEARFKRKEVQARDATSAMAEYEASKAATRKNTERLKALRLAKEAEDAKLAAIEAAKPKPEKPAKKKAVAKKKG